jgi:hypothetical protein
MCAAVFLKDVIMPRCHARAYFVKKHSWVAWNECLWVDRFTTVQKVTVSGFPHSEKTTGNGVFCH